MKTKIFCVSLITLLAGKALATDPVSNEMVWTSVYEVSAATPRLVISNIWGNVRVRAGEAGKITVTVDEHRTAPTEELFEQSHETVYLDVQADTEGVSMIVGGPVRTWRHFDRCPGCRVDYQFEVTVPPGAQIDVSTVTDGRVDVAGINGPISASNVNGPVTVGDLHNCQEIESVNGAIDLNFARAPSEDCNIETINGDITMMMPASAGLNAALDVIRGSVVSEFDVDTMALPAKVEQSERDGRYVYRIEQPIGVRLGGGGPTFTFSSLNGDIRIRKN